MTGTILVTGGAGYLGTQLLQRLSGAHGRILATDVREVPPERRVPGVEYVIADIRDAGLAALFALHDVRVVVHLASIVTPGRDSDRAFEYSVDVEGTRNVLEACVAQGVERVVVSSSGAAYGYHADNPAWITEECPLRGNEVFAYSHHKKLVEHMLAEYRASHPGLQQFVFRIGTIIGETVSNQITNLFEKRQVLVIGGSDSPFVFIWDQDVAACLEQAVTSDRPGCYNLAGDGCLRIQEIAALLGKPTRTLPAPLLRAALRVLKPLRMTQYGPEQLDFLRYRPVLLNEKLKNDFGFIPQKTSREAFGVYLAARHGRTLQAA